MLHIYLGDGTFSANFVRFSKLLPLGYIWKALEVGYLEHPGLLAVLKICLRCLSVLDGVCAACCLVNRQLPYLHINSHHMLLLPPMHHRSLWFAKEHALGVKLGQR